jgi:hypothetical protein
MRESCHAVRERLQAAKEVKLGIKNRKIGGVEPPARTKAALARAELEAMLDDIALRKGRSAMQQALSLSLKRFSEAHGGTAV